MSGFGKVTFIAEHFTNTIVNVFHYRSSEWLPLQGNPFDDVQAFLEAAVLKLKPHWLTTHNADTRLVRAEGVGYDDTYKIITASPLVKTIDEAGQGLSLPCSGSYQSANIGLRCGEQVQINGIGKSRRNRGYISVGPLWEAAVDSYGHVEPSIADAIEVWAQDMDDNITIIAPAVTLIPIRVHEKWLGAPPLRTLLWRTYSDVLGYTKPRLAAVRRSRMGEA